MTESVRIRIRRVDENGLVTPGTAMLTRHAGGLNVGDFRDLDGDPLVLPPGARFDVFLALQDREEDPT